MAETEAERNFRIFLNAHREAAHALIPLLTKGDIDLLKKIKTEEEERRAAKWLKEAI